MSSESPRHEEQPRAVLVTGFVVLLLAVLAILLIIGVISL